MNRIPNDDGMSIDNDNTVPGADKAIFVLRLKGNEKYSFRIYSPAFWGVWIHWMGTHTKPHLKDSNKCPGCAAQKKKEWKGYLHCWCYEKKQAVFLELTPPAANALLDQVGPGNTLRGVQVVISRTEKDNGRLLISVNRYADLAQQLPDPLDPHSILVKLWGMDEDGKQSGKEFPYGPQPSLNGHSGQSL